MYDVIVVGGGVVGASVALGLAQKTSLQIALVDEAPFPSNWNSDSYAPRVSAISHASRHFFQNIGVWDAISARRVSCYTNMEVWDANSAAKIHFDCADIAADSLGYIIEDALLRLCLFEKLILHPNVTLLSSTKCISLKQNENITELMTADGNVYRAKLLVGADGKNSWVRTEKNISVVTKDYQHTAIIAKVNTALSHQSTAWQRFLPKGPLAFLPLASPNECSIVWSTSKTEAHELMSANDDTFASALATAFGGKLGEISLVSQRYQFPLQKQHVKNYVQAGLVLVGDAAHTIHPLAGQGVNMGLLDAACLIEVISEAIAKQRDYASLHTLRRYERWRKTDNATMLTIVDGLKYIFAIEAKSFNSLREMGLSIINRTNVVKKFFMRYATGHYDGAPILAKKLK